MHQPGQGGIWKKFWLSGDTRAINAAPWMDALAQESLVGTCRSCGGYLKPAKPYRIGLIDWYPASCVGRGDTPACGTQTAAAGPRPKPKHNRKAPQ